ncbi:endonuclease/exonuclease/phosphatase family protein [Streptomyces odonnellii]|uniref:endonuclease/exonuclease/phosphatase family protein n=1 Tax=Streptomyces odonnellii TaxID=1417980 RepID=UPI0006250928|nr:endonuclease/exonuclease/phosphatase family protein [Streptomyces odonnellii]
MTDQPHTSVLTFNLNNPSRERAERQLVWLAARPEHVLVLTETADSAGCQLLAHRFEAAGYAVVFPRPERGERGVMIVSRLATEEVGPKVGYLPHRAVSVTVQTADGPLGITGLYVPSRDATPAKTARKRDFLAECRAALPAGSTRPARLVIGDFNLLEPAHRPRYPFFRPFEYSFYTWLGDAGYVDAFRRIHPDAAEYSWVGKTGDGYRYDHAHVTASLGGSVTACTYLHDVRTGPERLTDHSALSLQLALPPAPALLVSDPTTAPDQSALF